MSSEERPTVVIVDDEPGIRRLYTIYLQDDYDVRTAASGREALGTIDETVDAVLLDRRMPGASGDEVLEALHDRGYDGPVAMVTAVAPDFDIVDMGFDDYLVKPADREELRELVASLLRREGQDEIAREYLSLVSKIATLEAEKTDAELAGSGEYVEMAERLAVIKDDARATLDEAILSGGFDALLDESDAEGGR